MRGMNTMTLEYNIKREYKEYLLLCEMNQKVPISYERYIIRNSCRYKRILREVSL